MNTEENAVSQPARFTPVGVAALDGPPRYRNKTKQHLNGVQDPARYLRIRRAEFTCRSFATSLRRNREELRGKSTSEAESLIGLPSGGIAMLESADPCAPVGAWLKAWSWLGYLDNVNRAACMGMPTWGDAFAAFLEGPELDQDRMVAHLGLDAASVQAMRDSSPETEIHLWIGAWTEMEILRAVSDAAYPALEILAALAEAHAAAMPELDPELARALGALD